MSSGHVGAAAPPSTTFAAATWSISKRRDRLLALLVVFVCATQLIGDAVTSSVQVANPGSRNISSLRLTALAYGLPLIAASLLALTRHRLPRAWGSSALDLLVIAQAAYWLLASLGGLAAGNQLSYWVSTTFNFQVPVLSYLAVRTIRDPAVVDAIAWRIVWLCPLIAALGLAVTYDAAVVRGFVGAGGILHVVPLAAGITMLLAGAPFVGWFTIATSLLTILFSLKRISWASAIAFPLVYVAVSGATVRRVRVLGLALLLVLGGSAIVAARLPEAVSAAEIANRVLVIREETQGFSSGQAREDEVRSIWSHVVTNGSPLTLFFGRGMGATYPYYTGLTHGELFRNSHDTHFTPAGWFLRGGLAGVALNSAFYFVAILAGIRAARARVSGRPEWRGTFATFFVLAVITSVTSFALTPSPITHIMLALVVQRTAK